MMLTVLRCIRGYVRFSVTGKYPERFINITSRRHVRLWDIQRGEEGFSACMYRSDYRQIRTLRRKSGVRLRLSEKYGLPHLLFRYRDRAGVLIGMCAFILSVFVMSLFIWSIDINGLQTLSESQMSDLLRDHGLYVGAFKPGLDYGRISRDILIEQHEIGWMAVNVTGSYASVEVKEEAPPPEVEDVATPCNIKARCDGQILRIEAYEGDTVITEGSGVIENQLIVSGVKVDGQGASRLVHASARVIARTKRQASFSMSRQTAVLRPDGETVERKSFEVFGLHLPYRFDAVGSPYSAVTVRIDAPSPLGVSLPVGIRTERVSALRSVETEMDENSAKELLTREAELYEAFTLQDCTVEARDDQLSFKDGVYTLNVTYTCIEDIAYAEAIGTDENTDQTRVIAPTESKH